MNIFSFSVGSEAKRVAVRCVFAIGVVCWANFCCGCSRVVVPVGILHCKAVVPSTKNL